MNPENPTHVEIQGIYKTKMRTFKGYCGITAQVIPQLFGFTLLELRDLDYVLIGSDYEDYIQRTLIKIHGEMSEV